MTPHGSPVGGATAELGDDLGRAGTAPGSWRMRIRHRTSYVYETTVSTSYNEARLTPSSTNGQLVISSRIDVKPTARLEWYVDYWGTVVHTFDLHVAHRELTVTASSLVDTVPAATTTPDPTWEAVRADLVADRLAEYLSASSPVTMGPELDAPTAEVRSAPTPAAAVATALDIVTDRLEYVPGTTDVKTTDAEAWAHRKGVCQDYSHLAIALLRGAGVPARYASGYLYPGAGEIGKTVVGESHAWIEAWLGEWVPLDPTNRKPVGERHVLVARGRAYTDVPPLKGIVNGGGGTDEHDVRVELTRLAR